MSSAQRTAWRIVVAFALLAALAAASAQKTARPVDTHQFGLLALGMD